MHNVCRCGGKSASSTPLLCKRGDVSRPSDGFSETSAFVPCQTFARARPETPRPPAKLEPAARVRVRALATPKGIAAGVGPVGRPAVSGPGNLRRARSRRSKARGRAPRPPRLYLGRRAHHARDTGPPTRNRTSDPPAGVGDDGCVSARPKRPRRPPGSGHRRRAFPSGADDPRRRDRDPPRDPDMVCRATVDARVLEVRLASRRVHSGPGRPLPLRLVAA